MTAFKQRMLKSVLGNLSQDEVSNSIAYLKTEPNREGDRVMVGGDAIVLPWNAFIVFVDLEPGANWGHACCYLAIGTDNEEVLRIEAQMPPFLTKSPKPYNLLWRGPQAPVWAVETTCG